MREQTPFNIGPKAITPVARSVGGPLKPQVQKPVISQTAGEIAQALNNLIPGAEAYYKAEQTQDIEDAKVTAASMTVQEAISFAGKSVDEQADQLDTRALKAHSAANAAIGKKIAASREYSHESISSLYDPTKSAKEREAIHTAERANLLAGIPEDNPVMYAAAVEQADNYARQIASRADSVRQSRLENIAREETYDDSHDQVTNSLLAYAGNGNKFALRETLSSLDTTQRENYAGIAGVNAQHEAGVKDAFIGFAIDHPDEAQAALTEAATIGLFKKEEASEIQDKILQQVDIKDRRESRHEDLKFNDVQDLADQLIYDSIKEGIEPGTSVTDYLNSPQGAAVIQALEKKGAELGVDISSGRFSSVIRSTASTIFRDAGAGEFSIGDELEKELAVLGANEEGFVGWLEDTNLSPEQTSYAYKVFEQKRKSFLTKVDLLEVQTKITPEFLGSKVEKELERALRRGDFEAIEDIYDNGVKTWLTPSVAYTEVVPESSKWKTVDDISFRGTNSLQYKLESTTEQSIAALGFTDDDLRKESQRIIQARISNIPDWWTMTVEEKADALNKAIDAPLRMHETSFDDVVKIVASLPFITVDTDLSPIDEETFKATIESLKQDGNPFVASIEQLITDEDLNEWIADLDNTRNDFYELEDTYNVYSELNKSEYVQQELKEVLATPLVSAGTSIDEVISGVLYTDERLTINRTSFPTRLRDPRTGISTLGKKEVEPVGGIRIDKIIPKVEGTDLYDMTYIRIKDPDYEDKLNAYLEMPTGEAAESEIGLFISKIGPEKLPNDPSDAAVIDFVEYLKKANNVAHKRASGNTKKALYQGEKIDD